MKLIMLSKRIWKNEGDWRPRKKCSRIKSKRQNMSEKVIVSKDLFRVMVAGDIAFLLIILRSLGL